MRDRQKLEILLMRRFPGSTHEQIAAAVNAIMGLEDEWEDVPADSGLMHKEVDFTEYRLLRRRAV
jgi:hypothetical protein